MSSTSPPRPRLDPELEAVLAATNLTLPTLTHEVIATLRQTGTDAAAVDRTLAAAGVVRNDVRVPGFEGAQLVASVFRRQDQTDPGPGVYHLHGGGMVLGDRLVATEHFVPWIVEHGATVIAVDYRLAPDFPDPFPIEDSYAGLVWAAEHAAELGIDRDRLLVSGASAGGGLAAGVALMARDRGGPALAGQVLIYPMLDDRDRTTSSRQYSERAPWSRASIRLAWDALLGDRRGTDDVSIYAAPARATDLAGLPPAYLECGSAEVFRDESVAYASALWHAGGQAELHIWPGGFHGYDVLAPHTALACATRTARNAWVRRVLSS